MAQKVDLQERLKMRFLTVDYRDKQEVYGTSTTASDTGAIALDILNIPDYVLEDLLELTEPMMQLRFKNPLRYFSPFRYTTCARTAGFRVSESTYFPSRRDPKSACSAVTGNGMLSKAASPFRYQRSQKV